MSKKALIVFGGWPGHTPTEMKDMFEPWLKEQGYEVVVSDTLDSFADADLLNSCDLVVPMWTMGQMTGPQQKTLCEAIDGGVGIGGWHGGMCDAFRNSTNYQFMTGANWVAHPGNKIESYMVNITNHEHEITQGIPDFEMKNTEQYYLHVDPSNNVMAETTFVEQKVVMPVVWTRMWGKGRVFYSSLGHTDEDYTNVPEALEIARRGLLWATR